MKHWSQKLKMPPSPSGALPPFCPQSRHPRRPKAQTLQTHTVWQTGGPGYICPNSSWSLEHPPSTHPVFIVHAISFHWEAKQCSLLHAAAINTVNLMLMKYLTPTHAPRIGSFALLIFGMHLWDNRKIQGIESSLTWHFCPDTGQMSDLG